MGTLVTGTAATYVEELHINTDKRYEIVCITRDVERVVAESGIVDGLVLVNPMHITASCYVNDLEYGLHHDIMTWLEKLAPFYGSDGRQGEEYHHHRTGEDNGDAHLKRQLLGQQVYTSTIDNLTLTQALAEADVVIGALRAEKGRNKVVVSEEMVANMMHGSIIIDVGIDQGGCIETAQMTTHSDPVYLKHDIIHYCVPNIASRVSRTASYSLSNIFSHQFNIRF